MDNPPQASPKARVGPFPWDPVTPLAPKPRRQLLTHVSPAQAPSLQDPHGESPAGGGLPLQRNGRRMSPFCSFLSPPVWARLLLRGLVALPGALGPDGLCPPLSWGSGSGLQQPWNRGGGVGCVGLSPRQRQDCTVWWRKQGAEDQGMATTLDMSVRGHPIPEFPERAALW